MKLLKLLGLLVLAAVVHSGPVDSEDSEMETQTTDDTVDTGTIASYITKFRLVCSHAVFAHSDGNFYTTTLNK